MSADDGPRPPDDDRVGDDGGRDGGPTGVRRNGGDRTQDATGKGLLERVLTATDGPLLIVRETALSVGAVVVVGLLLFAISGVWPPMVAVESGSMEPHLERGDLVVVSEPSRYGPEGANGIVTTREAADFRSFGAPGNVVVYMPPDRRGSPIIHRARFHVEQGENWYDRANESWLDGAQNCEQLRNCPAPHAGYVTKGDNNDYYDQARGIATPVKPGWVRGEAQFHVPWLGEIRLFVGRLG